ncbi:transcription factor mef2A isoform X1 [Microplitis mediator]|uniref:transcription factor mef2A isoform X1 n=2 Tax=Microplitis mediator TaxID=375433 RepID=UPI0025570A50|nr:transcription factor mef2A isoform X1 [Microplitis mediator]
MVSQHAMATTVRKVKQENRLRRQNNFNHDEETVYKTISSSKSVPRSINNSQGRNNNSDCGAVLQVESGFQHRMPPLYGEEQTPNQNQQSLQTHSNKFPIEREVVLSSVDKNTKIPILHEYNKRSGLSRAIAPDAPVKQQAWVQEGNQVDHRQDHVQNFQPQDTYTSTPTGAVPRITKSEDDRTKSLSRTYHTIKDMISSRFGPSRKDIEPDVEVSLNNVTEEIRKSNKSIDEEDSKKKESIYGKSSRSQDPSVKMQHFQPNNAYNAQSYNSYYQSSQNGIMQSGQLSNAQLHPSLPGQSAQLHVSHITPPGGVQTVHQTQVSAYNPPVPGTRNDYVVQGSSGIQQPHQLQNPPVGKHGLPMQPVSAAGPNHQSYQSPQQLIHQSQIHQSPRFSHQHMQNMHQRQLIQQQQQHNMGAGQQPSPRSTARAQQQSLFPAGVSYQQYQQVRQTISRSQIDLPSTSRQALDVRILGQEVFYHYNKGRPGYQAPPQVYIKQDNNNKESNNELRSSMMEKAMSQPHLCYDDINNQDIGNSNPDNSLSTEKYEITVEGRGQEFADDKNDNAQRRAQNGDFRPDTSFGNRRDDVRCSKKDSDKYNQEQELSANDKNELGHNKVQEPAAKREDFSESNGKDGKKNAQLKPEERKSAEDKKTSELKKEDLENGMMRLKINHNQGSGSDYDKPGQSSSNVDSGRGSAVYSSGRRPPPVDQNHGQNRDSEWVDIVESELRSILEPSRDIPAMAHSTLSESVSSVTPPLPPLSPHGSPRTPRNRYTSSLPYGAKPNYTDYGKNTDKRNFQSNIKHRGASTSKKDATKKFSHLFGVEAADLTSTTTGLDLDSMLDRSDSDLSTNDARTIRKQLEGLENMYSEVLKLLGGSVKKRRKARGLTSYGSVSSLPTSSVSSRPIARHHDKRRSHVVDERIKKAKDIKSVNKRFQRLESHVVTLARSVAHLSSEMRTQHLMIQEMENIRGEIAALRTQTSMAMVRSQSQPLIKDAELPALSNPSRVKKLTKFFGTEPPLIRLFLRELGYEKYAAAFEKEKVGMVELPYLCEERLQKMGVPLGPRLRILQEARISVCKDPIYVV